MRSVKPTGWTGRIEGPVTPSPHQQSTTPVPESPQQQSPEESPSPQESRRDSFEDTNPAGGLYKFDLGMVPASVTPPPSWRRAAWFAVASSAATLGGLMFATAAMMGSNTTSIQGLELPSMPRGGEYPPLPATGNHVPTTESTGAVALEQRPSSPSRTVSTRPMPHHSDGSGAPGAAPPHTGMTDSPSTTPDGESPSIPGESFLPGTSPGHELPDHEPPGHEPPSHELPGHTIPGNDFLGGELSGDEPSEGGPTGADSADADSIGASSAGDDDSAGAKPSDGKPSGAGASGGEPSNSVSKPENAGTFGLTSVLFTDDEAIQQRTQQYFTAVSHGDLRDAYALTGGELRAEGYASFATRYASASSIEVIDSTVRDDSTVTTLRITRKDDTVITQRRELEFITDEKPMVIADTLVS